MTVAAAVNRDTKPAARRCAVFDFDGVLSRKDTMGWFVHQRLIGRPMHLLLALPFVILRRVLLRFAFHRSWTSRLLVRIAMAGLTIDEYVSLAATTGRELALIPGFARQRGLIELRQHLVAGDTVVVATGSEHHVAQAFLDELGIGGVALLASRVDPERGHVALHHYCVGRRKLADVREFLGEFENFAFYTDSTDDLPLAAVATHTHVINPNRRTAAAFRRRVWRLTIHRWI